MLIERVGAENVFDSIFVSVRRSCTLFKSCMDIAASGWCCFFIIVSCDGLIWLRLTVFDGGRGGGMGMFDDSGCKFLHTKMYWNCYLIVKLIVNAITLFSVFVFNPLSFVLSVMSVSVGFNTFSLNLIGIYSSTSGDLDNGILCISLRF